MFENMFQGKKILLRAPVLADADGYFALPEGMNTASQRAGDRVHFPVGADQRKTRLEEMVKQDPMGDSYFLLMQTPEGEVVGNINTHSISRFSGNFSYGIGVVPDHWGKGYASEALQLLLHFYFSELGFQKCNGHAYAFNENSIRLHERFGFVLEGRIRREHYAGGQYWDVLHFGITREEFWDKYGK